MIRLLALACGLLCGIGMVLSGLFHPSLLRDLSALRGPWDPVLHAAVALLAAGVTAAAVLALARGRSRQPLLGDEVEPVQTEQGWKVVAGGALFGLGWGLSGYFPLGAVVSAGLFAPDAVVFLASVVAGMFLCDLASNPQRLRRLGAG